MRTILVLICTSLLYAGTDSLQTEKDPVKKEVLLRTKHREMLKLQLRTKHREMLNLRDKHDAHRRLRTLSLKEQRRIREMLRRRK